MPALECNVRGTGQYMTVQNSEDRLHPETGFTIEALVTPMGEGEDRTVFSRPAGKKWEPPFVAYRLGFFAATLIPEFQLLFNGESTPVTVRGIKPVVLQHPAHLGRTYDGKLIGWDVAVMGLAEALAMTDLIALDKAAQQLLPPGELISVRCTNQMAAAEAIIDEFEKLLNMPGVREVQDIQPFLADPKRWFLLSPSCEHVWPQKMLGSKYKVDFLVKEAIGTYVAIEIESPNKKVYKSGREVDPHSDFTHAEQQVRNYCNYIDLNRDSVEREEGLAGVFRPRGVVVIGRRRDLSTEGAKKLKERNADSGRYTVMVYDDLIDQARHTVDRLKAMTS